MSTHTRFHLFIQLPPASNSLRLTTATFLLTLVNYFSIQSLQQAMCMSTASSCRLCMITRDGRARVHFFPTSLLDSKVCSSCYFDFLNTNRVLGIYEEFKTLTLTIPAFMCSAGLTAFMLSTSMGQHLSNTPITLSPSSKIDWFSHTQMITTQSYINLISCKPPPY